MAAWAQRAAWPPMGWDGERRRLQKSLSSVDSVQTSSLLAAWVVLRHLLRTVSQGDACSQCVKKGS